MNDILKVCELEDFDFFLLHVREDVKKLHHDNVELNNFNNKLLTMLLSNFLENVAQEIT